MSDLQTPFVARAFLRVALFGAVSALLACTPNPKTLKEAIEKDPSIVFTAIEKDPKGFFEAVERGQKNAQSQMAEDVWKNPLNPKVDESRVFEGNKAGKITIVEYADFLCHFCQQGHNTMKELMKKYPNDVRVLFKNKPILHPFSRVAARTYNAIAITNAEAAAKFKDLAFVNQEKLKNAVKADIQASKGKEEFKKSEALLMEFAKQAGADTAAIKKNLTDPKVEGWIEEDEKEADDLKFTGTPGYIVNGIAVRGAGSLENFSAIIDRHLSAKK